MTRVALYLRFWKIYLDTCCLSRLVDNLTQDRVLREAETIQTLLEYFQKGQWYWITSDAVTHEVNQNPNVAKRVQITSRLAGAHQNVPAEVPEIFRGKQLEELGFNELDALHIACAESGKADLLFTTDDKFLSRGKRHAEKLQVRVENPYAWLQETIGNEPIHEGIRNDRG